MRFFGSTGFLAALLSPIICYAQAQSALSVSPGPTNDSVIAVQELRASGKATSAFTKGVKLLQRGETEASIRYFQRALTKDPGYYRAYHNLGLAHYRLGDSAQAEQDFQKCIDLTNGGYAPSEFALGMILLENGEARQAENLFQRGLELEPGSAVGKYFLGLAQFSLSHFQDAEESAHDALWRNASQADAYILLAKIHEQSHNPSAVLSDVSAYLRLDPSGPLQAEAFDLRKRAERQITQASR